MAGILVLVDTNGTFDTTMASLGARVVLAVSKAARSAG